MAQAISISNKDVVAVVGTGAMGAGIAQVAATAGHLVLLFDSRASAAQKAVDSVAKQLRRLVDRSKMTQDQAQSAINRLKAVANLSDLSPSALVVEAIVENLEAKQTLFKSLESIVGPNTLFATNTSAISVTAIGAVLDRPERLGGLHFFNPAPLMALVEVVSGLATDQEVAEALFLTAKAWGKTPVYTKSTPGFIVNRVARSFYAEGLRVLQEGGADVPTLDACCTEAGGFRMGPFTLMDLIGNDVNLTVTKTVWAAFYYDQRFLPSLVQQELVAAGYYGKKTGRGHYDYREGVVAPKPKTELDRSNMVTGLSQTITVFGDSPAAEALASRLHHSGLLVTRQGADDDRIAQIGKTVLYVSDGRTATRRAAETHQPHLVCIDLALDYHKATRIAVASALSCGHEEKTQAIALLQKAGFAVSVFQDIPGLIVMRTVAMLANEAADAVYQGVCDESAVDSAMCLGVNYPRGPLSWARQLGLSQVRSVLVNLGHAYGEDRYRISPWIQQQVLAEETQL
jgi:3-hydroxybutyryl-CoA dehydrogenase